MRRLSYSKVSAVTECPKKGWAMHTRSLPPPMGDMARRILLGHVVDRIIQQVYDERLWETAEPASLFSRAILEIDKVLVELVPVNLDPKDRERMVEKLRGLVTAFDQMQTFGLLPTKDVRVQASVERDLWGLTLVGTIDLLVANEDVSVVDVKTGTYRSREQLSWYVTMLEGYGILPSRVGFWMPLVGEIEWKPQRNLPAIEESVKLADARLTAQDQRAIPGVQCKLCALAPQCDEGLRYKHAMKVASEHLALDSPGVHHVGFGASK